MPVNSTPKFVLDAVRAEQERKRLVLAELQDELRLARIALSSVQDKVDSAKNELDAMQAYLQDAEVSLCSATVVNTPKMAYGGDASISVKLKGREIRSAVLEIAMQFLDSQESFATDDLMHELKLRRQELDVANPRTRVSQILTIDPAITFDNDSKCWKKKSPVAAGLSSATMSEQDEL